MLKTMPVRARKAASSRSPGRAAVHAKPHRPRADADRAAIGFIEQVDAAQQASRVRSRP